MAEDRDAVLRQARNRLPSFDPVRLQRAADSFGNVATRKRLREWAGGSGGLSEAESLVKGRGVIETRLPFLMTLEV